MPHSHNLKQAFFHFSLFLSFAFTLSPDCYASEIKLSRSKLVQLALHLEVADKSLQYDFSRIAIVEMINTYQYELQRSLENSEKTQKKRVKKRGWQIASRSYVKSLDESLFLMDSGLPLDFLVTQQNKILILIGDHPVLISGPHSGGDRTIEKNIVEQFCLQYDCTEYFKKTVIPSRNQTSSEFFTYDYSDISGAWAIHSDLKADYIMNNSLTFKFLNIKNRSVKESRAIAISKELSLLGEELKLTKQKGNKIQWSSLMIEELPLTDNAFKVIINDKDYIKVIIPQLGSNHLLLQKLIPWLQAYVESKKIDRILIDQDNLN